jgi:hypothetical protein
VNLQAVGARVIGQAKRGFSLPPKVFKVTRAAEDCEAAVEAVGTALETLYGEGADESVAIAVVAPRLAWHFQAGGIPVKAVAYLLQAGKRAVRMSANEEAIAHFTQGLELLETLPDSPERVQQELALQIVLAAPLQALKGYGDPKVGRTCARARELCQQMGETPQLSPVLYFLADF